MSTGSRRPVVILAGAPFTGVRRSARAMAEALAAHGPVLYVDPSRTSRDGTGIALSPPVDRVSENLWHLAAVAIPGHTRRGIAEITTQLIARRIRGAIDEIDAGPPLAALLQTPQAPALRMIDADVKVYWATDDFTAGARLMGVDPDTMAAAEQRAASEANVVVAVSDPLAERWTRLGKDAVVIPTGVDVPPRASLTVDAAPLPLPPPVVGVFGTLSPRLDFAILDAVAATGISILLVGPASFRYDRDAFDALLERENVHWVGQQPHDTLPAFYAAIKVGLVPYVDSPFNRASAPLKPMEYLAMGKSVVATPLPAILRIASPDIAIAADPTSFARTVADAASATDAAADIDRRRSQMETHDWTARADAMLREIDLRARG